MTDDKKIGAGPVRQQPTTATEQKKTEKKKEVLVEAPLAIHGASESTEDFFYRTGEKTRVKLPAEVAKKLRLAFEDPISSDEASDAASLHRKGSLDLSEDEAVERKKEAARPTKTRDKQPVKGDDSSSQISSDELQHQGPRAGLITPPNRNLKKKKHAKHGENAARSVSWIPGIRRIFLSKAALSNQQPQLITANAAAEQIVMSDLKEFAFLPTDASAGQKQNYTRERIESNFNSDKKIEMDMSTTSHVRLNFGDNCPQEIRAEILQRFDVIKKNKGIYIYLPELRPSWVKQDWFSHLAIGLTQVPVEATIKVDGKRAAHSQGMVDAHPVMQAITAAALTMKINGDVEAFGRVFSLAPAIIAADFRSARMGKAIGTQATRALLKSIFDTIKATDYAINDNSQVLLQAAADLLAAHLGRDDHRALVTSGQPLPENYKELLGMVKGFENIERSKHGTIKKRADLERHVKMASMREGVIYGAMLLYNKDLTERNAHHLDVIDAFAEAAFSILAAGASVGSGVGGAAVSAGGTLLRTYVKAKVAKDVKDLAADIINSFSFTAALPATTERRILFLGQLGQENADLANLYATTARQIIDAIATS